MATFNLTTASGLFKRNYLKYSENMYNSQNVTDARIKKLNDFTGDGLYMAIPLSFSGSVGSGSLPTASVATYSQAVISSKKVYGTALIDRETIKASANDEGSFVRGLKEVVKKTVESYARNASRILFGTGDGSLGTTSGTSGPNPYVLTLDAGYNEANFEENDIINVETGNTDPFRIDAVAPQTDGTLDITVTRLSGSQTPDGTDELFMQNSEDADPHGLKNVLDATSSTLYSISVARRWQATQQDASDTALTPELMNDVMLAVDRKFGKSPNLIVTSHTQFGKLLNIIEDQKRYPLGPRYGSDELKAKISWSGLEFMSIAGAVPIVPDRFCDQDRMYFLNEDFIERHHRPEGVTWFDDDGTVFLREASADSYSARYGGYWQNFIRPTAHGVLTSLAV